MKGSSDPSSPQKFGEDVTKALEEEVVALGHEAGCKTQTPRARSSEAV